MTYCVWWSNLQIGQSHPTGLTTNLLKLFEPRAPLEFKPPPEKRKCPPYQGMALVLLVLFWFQSALWQCTRILALQKILTLCKKDRVLCFYHSYSNFFLSYLCITVKKIASTSFMTLLWFQSLSIGLFRALLWSFRYFPSYSVLFLEQLVIIPLQHGEEDFTNQLHECFILISVLEHWFLLTSLVVLGLVSPKMAMYLTGICQTSIIRNQDDSGLH